MCIRDRSEPALISVIGIVVEPIEFDHSACFIFLIEPQAEVRREVCIPCRRFNEPAHAPVLGAGKPERRHAQDVYKRQELELLMDGVTNRLHAPASWIEWSLPLAKYTD